MSQLIKEPGCCKICSKDHRPPADLIESIKWRIEQHEGLHKSACADSCLPVYPKNILIKLLQTLDPSYKKKETL